MRSGWRVFTKSPRRLRLVLTVSALLSFTVPLVVWAITWVTQTWDFNVAGDYQVPSAQKVEFVSLPGPTTVARLKLNMMSPYTVNTTLGFSPRTNLVWSSSPAPSHLELVSASQTGQMPTTEPNVVGLWRFNESSGTIAADTMGSTSNTFANNGTMFGFIASPWVTGTLRDAFGNPTNALQFAGDNDEVRTDFTTDSPDLWMTCTTSPCPGLSIEAWVRFDRLNTQEVIVSHAGSYVPKTFWVHYPVYMLYKNTSNQLVFALRSFSATAQEVMTNPITTGQWYHVVATYSGNLQQIYVNGAPNGSTSTGFVNISSTTYSTYTHPTWIGRQEVTDENGVNLPPYYFQGALDELALYNTALSPATITQHFTGNSIKIFDPRVGSHVSRVIDADPVNQIVKQWQNLTWTEGPSPTTGLGEELPNTLAGLQGLWHFNEGSGATASDVAGTPNNGTLTNGPIWTTGKFGNALFFDGVNDYVQVSGTPVTATTNWTLEAWVYYTGTGGSANGAAVVYNGDPSTGRGYGIWRGDGTANNNFISVRYGGTYFSTGVPYDVNAWNHIVAVRTSGGVLTVYKNGVQIGAPDLDGAASPTAPSAADPISIGGVAGASGFGGRIDEVALYNTALSSATILDHSRQGALNLRFQGRSGPCSDPTLAACAPQWSPWKPADGAPIANLTYGLLGLWHLDNNANDDIGGPTNTAANPLTLNGGPTYVSGKFNQGLSLNGAQSASLAATPLSSLDNWTLEAWVYYNGTGGAVPQGAGVVYNGTIGTNGYGIWRGDGTANNNFISVRYGNTYFSTGVPYDVNAWNHIVAVRANTILKVYKNGDAIGSTDLDGGSLPTAPAGLQIGTSFGGLIDEVAIYNVALDEHTILGHYLGSAFTVSPATLATILGGTIPDNRYFQFRTFLSSDSPVRSPELSSVTVTAQNYPLDAPTIINTTVKPTYTLLNSFTESRGPATGQGQVRYQLSPNGTLWYWYNGTSWVADTAASDLIESNTALQLTPNPASPSPSDPIAQFPTQVGSGNLQWKAILSSDGTQPVELDKIDAQYASASLTLTAPALNETWLVGSTHPITWGKTGTIANVKLEYSPDGGTSWQTIIASTPNNGSYNWTLDPATISVSANSNPGQGAAKLRISGVDSGTESVTDTSANAFTVSQLDLTSPVANATWLVGNSYPITWTTSATDVTKQVKIEYAKDGSTFAQIGTASATAGTFSWTPAASDISSPTSNPATGISKVRIAYVDAPAEFNGSPNFVVSQLQLTAPGATTWLVGKTYTVSWQTSAAASQNVKLQYLPQAGGSWQDIPGATAISNTGSFNWTIDPATQVSLPNSTP